MREQEYAQMEMILGKRDEENTQLNEQIEEMSKRVDSLLADNAELMELQRSYEEQMLKMTQMQSVLEEKLDIKLNGQEVEVQTDEYLWRDFV